MGSQEEDFAEDEMSCCNLQHSRSQKKCWLRFGINRGMLSQEEDSPEAVQSEKRGGGESVHSYEPWYLGY